MTAWRRRELWLAGLVLLGTSLPVWSAPPPTIQEMLRFKPVQKAVAYSTPAAGELDQCKVQGTGDGRGWLLRDPKGNLLRKFYDNDGNNYPDQWSYYKDGLEVYRELDTNGNNRADQYRWLNTAGMKVGTDRNEDGVIDAWLAISPEELSQEVVKAVIARDYKHLETLMVTEPDLKSLGAPATEIGRIQKVQEQAPAKFQQTVAKLGINESTRWVRLETGAPSCLPADMTGMKQDVRMYYRGVIFCDTAGKPDWIQLGEIVLIGEAWKLIDAPLPGGAAVPDAVAGRTDPIEGVDPKAQAIIDQLAALDKDAPREVAPGPNAGVARYHLQRAALLEQIVAVMKDKDRGMWQRQWADSLSSAAQASPPSDKRALDQLGRLAANVAREAPASELAAYVAFREMSADYSIRISNESDGAKLLAIQKDWLEKLAKFVGTYPKGEDKPDALLQLGMIHELQGKETEARKWYEQLTRELPSSPQAVKANGALRRLNLEGKPWELNAPVVSLSGGPFSVEKTRGRVTVVYYWAKWCDSAPADFAKLKQLAQDYRSKGLEIVAINVDDSRQEAEEFIRKHSPPGHQLYTLGGLESPLATHYGLIVFPNVFLVGKDGKVVSRTVQIGTLEEELKKAFK